MALTSIIKGTGSYLPERVMTNADLEKIVETSDEWIVQRSGIKERHIAAKDETTGMMAIKAAQKAMQAAGVSATDIDGVIVATTTPDRTFPSVAVKVQGDLGIAPCLAFDIQAVCTGFVYALATADNFIKMGQAKCILVIGAEKMSSIVDWTDRTTCVLFADGAGAVILEAAENDRGLAGAGIHSTHLYANGAQRALLQTTGGVSSTGENGVIQMQGREVFKYAVNYMADVVEETLKHNNIDSSSIDWLVPHQANIRIIESTAKKLDMPMDKVVVTVDRHGNTSAASIPLALDEAVRDGRIKRGQMMLIEAMGGGLTWGAALVRY
ncbi:MAG: ketoacyl-ACP synthase III [Alphaproteobacteria bacterium]|nr:ketoacyl-ACP synthase III [Alphaproteobacteria bacterium]NCQ88151.1 ketoacyl-ACP synthase III [Alphaproteobacteria bacterium]NCT05342.1 ketoacyl-ACP synthase III [Alphaproteobacteria bacterium]